MPKAILSVYDKSGLVEFGRGLRDLGWELIASGGTARLLRDNELAVTEVAETTGSPEILGGRVKTLHPAIHGGLLARDSQADIDQLQGLGWAPIDLAAVNLYPFEQTIANPDASLQEAIENIDIGGVALIRAAAKNFERVTLVCDPADYPQVLEHLRKGSLSRAVRRSLAVKGFQMTAHYDTCDQCLSAGSISVSGFAVLPGQHAAIRGKPAPVRNALQLSARFRPARWTDPARESAFLQQPA